MKKSDNNIDILLAELKTNSRISISDAKELLHTSESTTRRLFARLETDGKAIRVHGGLVLLNENSGGYVYENVETIAVTEKRRIAALTAQMLCDGGNIYMDSGSTVCQVGIALACLFKNKNNSNICVFTNSLKLIEVLDGIIPVQLIGGAYRTHRRDFCGFLAENALRSLRFDVCVLGADGVSIKDGLTTTDFDCARLNSIIIERSQKCILAADSRKFSINSLIGFAPLNAVTTVVTDSALDSAVKESIEKIGVSIHIA